MNHQAPGYQGGYVPPPEIGFSNPSYPHQPGIFLHLENFFQKLTIAILNNQASSNRAIHNNSQDFLQVIDNH